MRQVGKRRQFQLNDGGTARQETRQSQQNKPKAKPSSASCGFYVPQEKRSRQNLILFLHAAANFTLLDVSLLIVFIVFM